VRDEALDVLKNYTPICKPCIGCKNKEKDCGCKKDPCSKKDPCCKKDCCTGNEDLIKALEAKV